MHRSSRDRFRRRQRRPSSWSTLPVGPDGRSMRCRDRPSIPRPPDTPPSASRRRNCRAGRSSRHLARAAMSRRRRCPSAHARDGTGPRRRDSACSSRGSRSRALRNRAQNNARRNRRYNALRSTRCAASFLRASNTAPGRDARPRRRARAWARAGRRIRVRSHAHHQLAAVVTREHAGERAGHLLEAFDDVDRRFQLSALEPSRQRGFGLGAAVVRNPSPRSLPCGCAW